MVHLVDDELSSALHRQRLERANIRFGDHRAGRVVRGVDENELGAIVHERSDFREVEGESFTGVELVSTHFEAERLRNREKRGKRGVRKHHVGPGLRGEKEERQERFRGPGNDLDLVGLRPVHGSELVPKRLGAVAGLIGNRRLEEPLVVLRGHEAAEVIERPTGAGARGEVVPDLAFVALEPLVEKERSKFHVGLLTRTLVQRGRGRRMSRDNQEE
jgi:hypothetical protein